MQEQLNGIFLNEIVTSVLLLITIIILFNSLVEWLFLKRIDGGGGMSIEDKRRNRDFSLFLFFCTLYLACMLIWIPIEKQKYGNYAIVLFSYVRVLFATLAYRFSGGWIIGIIEEKRKVHAFLKFMVCRGVYILYILSLIIYELTEYALLANIPICLFYIVSIWIVVYYRRALGKVNTQIMLWYFVPSVILMIQEWWNYTLANIYLVVMILLMYSRMWLIQKEKYLQEQQLYAMGKIELDRVKTKFVLSQIKPHFIYNTLGTISYLCENNPSIAQKMTLDLADYLRGKLSTIDSEDMIPFSIELDNVRTFLNISEVRFGNVIHVKYDFAVTDFEIPILTVEPLVENAVKHGICQKEGGGCICISTRENNECYQVVVQDDGAGFSMDNQEWCSSEHVGLSSVKKRIEILCGGRMELESKLGQGTCVRLYIPKK